MGIPGTLEPPNQVWVADGGVAVGKVRLPRGKQVEVGRVQPPEERSSNDKQ